MRWTQELRWWRCAGLLLRDSRRLAPALRPWLIAAPTGCTPAQVRLKEFGSELIEVADNGCGVSPSDYSALAAKYHTSKVSCSVTRMLTRCRHSLPAVYHPRQLNAFTDLTSLATFGFRGEALSSLCALCELSVVTRTETEARCRQRWSPGRRASHAAHP
jgi:hypothetical protein